MTRLYAPGKSKHRITRTFEKRPSLGGAGIAQKAIRQTNEPHTQDIPYFQEFRELTKGGAPPCPPGV